MIQLHSQITHLVAEIGLRDDPDLWNYLPAPVQEVDCGIRTRWGVMLAEPLMMYEMRGEPFSYQEPVCVLSFPVGISGCALTRHTLNLADGHPRDHRGVTAGMLEHTRVCRAAQPVTHHRSG